MIKVENLSYAYDKQNVLQKVSFQINEGELVGLLGLSGSGKTTLLKILCGLLDIKQGEYTIKEQSIQSTSKNTTVRKEIGVVFQDYQLFMHMNVLENLALPYRLVKKVSKEVAEQKALEILDKLGLINQKNQYPYQCSGGQQQRIAIGRALILQPSILFIDEPTAALDFENTEKIREYLKSLNQSGLTIVAITHDLPFAQKLCDRVIELNEGQLQFDGSAEDFFKSFESM